MPRFWFDAFWRQSVGWGKRHRHFVQHQLVIWGKFSRSPPKNPVLVGGLEHLDYFFHNIWDNPSQLTNIFRGIETTNQVVFCVGTRLNRFQCLESRMSIHILNQRFGDFPRERAWKVFQSPTQNGDPPFFRSPGVALKLDFIGSYPFGTGNWTYGWGFLW